MFKKPNLRKMVSISLLLTILALVVPSVQAQPTPNIVGIQPASMLFYDPFKPLPPLSQPYVAGYFDGPDPDATTTRVQITVNFPNTPPSGLTIQDVIPYDNYVAGGMFLQGMDNARENTDYGFLASLSLDHWGTIQYNMAFYVDIEADPLCLPPILAWYQLLWQSAIVLSVNPSTPVTLTMQWNGDLVQWLYTINGNTYTAASINAPSLYSSTMQRCFHIGAYFRDLGLASPPASDYCYFYQFGMYSKQVIANSGWKVRLEQPKYYDASINQMRLVYRASGIQGTSSYIDHWWRWGGEFYDARASYYNSYFSPLPYRFLLEFDWHSDHGTYLYDGQLLWEYPENAPEPPSTPSGPSSGYRWTTYTYTTATIDPNGNSVRYQFDWGDGTSTWTGYYSSGATASASHSWGNVGAYIIRVRAQDTTGLYSDWSYDKKVNIINKPGGCPTLFVWDGSEYTQIGVLGIHAESDTTFMQGIEPILLPEHHLYKLSLRELDQYTSHIDYVKLYVVDNDVGTHECHLVQAVHSELGQVESLLLRDDNERVDLNPQQTIELKFTVPNVDRVGYVIFEINGYNRKPP